MNPTSPTRPTPQCSASPEHYRPVRLPPPPIPSHSVHKKLRRSAPWVTESFSRTGMIPDGNISCWKSRFHADYTPNIQRPDVNGHIAKLNRECRRRHWADLLLHRETVTDVTPLRWTVPGSYECQCNWRACSKNAGHIKEASRHWKKRKPDGRPYLNLLRRKFYPHTPEQLPHLPYHGMTEHLPHSGHLVTMFVLPAASDVWSLDHTRTGFDLCKHTS